MRRTKFALDSMVYDRIAADSHVRKKVIDASARALMVLLSTHIQEDQLAATPDPAKRPSLLAALQEIAPIRVPTAGAVWDLSKWGEATWGDGSDSGIIIGQVDSPARKHTTDALIATTGARDADVLVTDDTRLRKRVKGFGAKCEVWGFERFKAHVLSL